MPLIYMQHERHGNNIVYTEEDALSCEKLGWKRAEFPSVRTGDDKEALIKEAESLGIKVDKRWSISRIRKEIEGE